MPTTDPRVDAYIAKSAEFSQPILIHLRDVVHAACPEATETIKWGFPHFEYKGLLCSMASFKAHCGFGFWSAEVLPVDPDVPAAMGQLGRITSIKDLPPKKTLTAYIKKAMQLNDAGVKATARSKPPKGELVVPDYFVAALKANKPAQGHFKNFSTSKQRDYVEWLEEAKTEPTRVKRMAQAVEWIAEGKSRNWKYEKC